MDWHMDLSLANEPRSSSPQFLYYQARLSYRTAATRHWPWQQWLHGQKYARDKATKTLQLYLEVKGAFVRLSERVL
jgi:hypothetical protein